MGEVKVCFNLVPFFPLFVLGVMTCTCMVEMSRSVSAGV